MRQKMRQRYHVRLFLPESCFFANMHHASKEKSMERTVVIVRDYAGKPRLARLVADRGDVVDVASVDLQSIANAGTAVIPVGFRRADVFRYDGELLNSGDFSRAEAWPSATGESKV
jgi:hypothetical protein